jgi:hypothetical protein
MKLKYAKRRQLNLFAEPSPAPTDPLIGLAVRLPHDPCRCGTNVAEIGPGKGPHLASLSCRACGAHRGWISHTTHEFLTAIVNKFGCPETPIVIQRGRSDA